ncbi:MAG: hypothetical protein J4F38_07860 [Pseudomonadales bacterium]|nr:hypothetical protein [Pseudomonadales bacterium]
MAHGLVEKIDAIHRALTAANLPHAFGGALALAWCVGEPRATIDVDVNIFIAEADAGLLRGVLPAAVTLSPSDIARLTAEGQLRTWWDATPIDVFLNSTPLHESAAERAQWEMFGGTRMPFLSCLDTAIFKAFFNRTKDWSDLEEMRKAGKLDADTVREILVDALGETDERVRTLDRLAKTGRAFQP